MASKTEWCHEAPFYTSGAHDRHRAGYDHITSGIGPAMIAGMAARCSCYVTPKELKKPGRKEGRERRRYHCTRLPRTAADLAKGAIPARQYPRQRIEQGRRFEFRW